MFCGIPDPGLTQFLAHDTDDLSEPAVEGNPGQILAINALVFLCLCMLPLWA